MKVFIIGIAGGVGRRLAEQLAEAGEEPVGLVRRAEQADALASRGIRTVSGDLVAMSVEELAAALRGSDVVVFSAGAGGNRLILELTGGDTAIREGIGTLTIHSSKDQRAAP